jgi:hypothetical protein
LDGDDLASQLVRIVVLIFLTWFVLYGYEYLDFRIQPNVYLTPTSEPTIQVRELVSRTFIIYDESGSVLGDGEVRLYAPEELHIAEASEVRLEISISVINATLAVTSSPPASATPQLGTPRPTSTLLPLSERQFIEVREFMGAGLRGRDVDLFEITSVPPDGLRRMYVNQVNWWRWNIRALEEAIGTRQLEVYIYLPETREDGMSFSRETNILFFQLEVLPTATQFFDTTLGRVSAIAGAVAAIAGAVAAIYAGFKWLKERVRTRRKSLSDAQLIPPIDT